jgi:hypothetical protein
MFERDWQRAMAKEKFASMLGRENKSNKVSGETRLSRARRKEECACGIGGIGMGMGEQVQQGHCGVEGPEACTSSSWIVMGGRAGSGRQGGVRRMGPSM